MSGHSKWATTKHKKAVIDAKRGKLFAKLIKNIEVAARTGGADLDGNPTLFDAVQKAKKQSVPNKNIDSALKRGAGLEAGGADYETIMYEGYGPNGVAVLIECLTDNRNRAASDVRVAMTRNGGSMADPGSVSYLFNRKGVILLPKAELSEDDVLGAVLDAGAEEVNDNGDTWETISEATDLVAVRTALQEAGIDYDSAESSFVPTMQVELDEEGARKISLSHGRIKRAATTSGGSGVPAQPDNILSTRHTESSANCSWPSLGWSHIKHGPAVSAAGPLSQEIPRGRIFGFLRAGHALPPPAPERPRSGRRNRDRHRRVRPRDRLRPSGPRRAADRRRRGSRRGPGRRARHGRARPGRTDGTARRTHVGARRLRSAPWDVKSDLWPPATSLFGCWWSGCATSADRLG